MTCPAIPSHPSQTAIAAKIIDEEADYCLAVKGNQETLHQGLKAFFLDHQEDDFTRTQVRRYESEETGHGRKDVRSYFICPVPDDLPDAARWKRLKAIGLSINKTVRNGKKTMEARYYILR